MAEVLDLLGSAVRPVGLVGPRGAGRDRLAKTLDLAPRDDLRPVLRDHPGATLFAASLGELKPADLAQHLDQGGRVLTLGPAATTFPELREFNTADPRRGILYLPAFLDSPGALAAADPHPHLGTPRLLRFASLGRPEHGPLFGRLLDAWHTALSFTDLPETVDAALFPAGPGPGPDATPRRIAGHLAAHARLPAGGSITLTLSDRAATTARHLDLIGDTAHLRLTDTAYTLLHPDGTPVDADASPPSPRGRAKRKPPPPGTYADLVAHRFRRLLDRPDAPPPAAPADRPRDAMACAHACLLSARTRQPERPGTLLQLHR